MKQKLSRRDFWSDHIKSWRSSNLSQSEYCRRKNLDINLFSKWKRRNANTGFVEVKTKVSEHDRAGNFMEISVYDTYKIRVNPDFDDETLKRILSLLGEKR